MESIRQKCRPKHQVLILKCYPRFQKNAVEVKPNSSELSYLLYYASTRRSKLQKVGAFLEKKTAIDVARSRSSNAQITLQILVALIEKCPRDLPLFSFSVLNVLHSILHSNDVVLLQDSLILFESFCKHYDTPTLSADYNHMKQYDDIIALYASLAIRGLNAKDALPTSVPTNLRHRTAGLRALKSLVSSNAFAADDGRQLKIVMPVLLRNLYSEHSGYLALLQFREGHKSKQDNDASYKSRQSATMSRQQDSLDIDPETALGTAAEIDQRANQDASVIALQSLRQIFSQDNRNQLRVATSIILTFATARARSSTPVPDKASPARSVHLWATSLFQIVSQWTSVQDRFIILVTATETLIRSPILEDDLQNQLLITEIVGSLLRSSVNFIGLSVIDVLIGFIQHILLLLQLGGEGSQLKPHPQQSLDVLEAGKIPPAPALDASSPTSNEKSSESYPVRNLSPMRLQLLERLQSAIGDLATHVYYSDQITDMLSTLLLRLKPASSSSIATTASAIENPCGTLDVIADSAQLQEKSHTDDFFSFDTARVIALGAVKQILIVANSSRKDGTIVAARNRVGVSVWEGTQWLLRDPFIRVRKLYADALTTWLDLELDRTNMRIVDDQQSKINSTIRRSYDPNDPSAIAKRALSVASRSSAVAKKSRSTFLQLLHLAIYENALDHAESEADILLLHVLLQRLTSKLGINSARFGLPMIFRLQHDVSNLQTPGARILIGSLVHGYFWALSDIFAFDTSNVGREIFHEINRRTKSGLWLKDLHMPPLPLEKINVSGDIPSKNGFNSLPQTTEPLILFESRRDMVEEIADSYSSASLSPPSSPPLSPKRPMSPQRPLSARAGSSTISSNKLPPALMVPLSAAVKEQMMSEWSRETCIASAENSTKAASVNGSKSVSNSGIRNRLTINGFAPMNGNEQDQDVTQPDRSRLASNVPEYLRQRSPGSDHSADKDSVRAAIVHVSDLKRILAAGHHATVTIPAPQRTLDGASDTRSDSMVSADFSTAT